jgi:hypothetical protein
MAQRVPHGLVETYAYRQEHRLACRLALGVLAQLATLNSMGLGLISLWQSVDQTG